MTLLSSVLFAKRLVFPRIEKQSSARRSLLGALLCIGISLIPLVVVMSISNGMIEGITSRIIGLSSSHLQVNTYNSDKYKWTEKDLISLAEKLKAIDGITCSYPELNGTGLASSAKGRTGASIRAVPLELFTQNKSFASLFTVVEGNVALQEPSANSPEATAVSNAVPVAFIGQKIASELDLKAGSKFRLITTRSVNGKIVPRLTTFTVGAIVSCGYQELDALWVFIPLEKGFSILAPEGSSASVKLEVENPFSQDLERIYYAVQRKAGKNTRVYRWDELNVSEYENFSSTKVLLMFIMFLIVLVASVNIFSALIMLSMERRREIAILKCFGATKAGISFSFLITGFLTGLGGLLLGLPAGLMFSVNINKVVLFIEKILNFVAEFVYLFKGNNLPGYSEIHLLDPAYYLQNIPVAIPFFELAVISAGTLLLTLAASLIPAIKAGKEKPLETFRKI